MDAQDAVTASNFIECDNIIAMHFDTFGFIKIDHEQVESLFANADKKVKLPTIGESFKM